jgi:hypothetical protein
MFKWSSSIFFSFKYKNVNPKFRQTFELLAERDIVLFGGRQSALRMKVTKEKTHLVTVGGNEGMRENILQCRTELI